jgi:hypothetical protein
MEDLRKKKISPKLIAVILLVLVVFAGTSGGLVYYFEDKIKKTSEELELIILEKEDELERYRISLTKAYVLLRDIEAGETVSSSDIELVDRPVYYLPENYVSDASKLIGKVMRLSAKRNTPITEEMVYNPSEMGPSDRKVELQYVNLPILLKPYDIIDIMITFPNAETYRVLTKKKIDAVDTASQYLFITANAEERYLLMSALVDAYNYNAEIYALRYVDPQVQPEPLENYPPNKDVLRLLATDPYVEAKDRFSPMDILRENLENRLESIPADKRTRVGSVLPEGSAVSKKLQTVGATIIVPNIQGETAPVQQEEVVPYTPEVTTDPSQGIVEGYDPVYDIGVENGSDYGIEIIPEDGIGAE